MCDLQQGIVLVVVVELPEAEWTVMTTVPGHTSVAVSVNVCTLPDEIRAGRSVEEPAPVVLLVHGRVTFCHFVLTTNRGEVVAVVIVVVPPGHELQDSVRVTYIVVGLDESWTVTVVGRSTTVMDIADAVTVWLTTIGRGVTILVVVTRYVEVMTFETVVPSLVTSEVTSTVVGVVIV